MAGTLSYAEADTPQWPFTYKVGGVATSIVGFTLTALLKQPDGTVVSRAHTAVDEANGKGRFDIQAGDLLEGKMQVDIEIDNGSGVVQTACEQLFLDVCEDLG